jgi:hypothetical protein
LQQLKLVEDRILFPRQSVDRVFEGRYLRVLAGQFLDMDSL